MGALLVTYVIGSFVGIPFLAFQLLRTRRELNGLRDELHARGLIAHGRAGAPPAVAGARDAARPLARGDAGDPPASVAALAAEVERIAERQRALAALVAERAGAEHGLPGAGLQP
jgi:hypothetical protein